MGRICPILNHPLNDGVLVNDDALVSFIQKRNVDFLAHEYVCRSCKREVEKLYKKKLKRATELNRSRYHDASVSTLRTSRDTSSSGSSVTSQHSVILSQSKKIRSAETEITQNGKSSSSISVTSLGLGKASETKTNVEITENQQNLGNIQQNTLANVGNKSAASVHKYVTVRKKTIKDFYTPKSQKSNEAAIALISDEKPQTIYQTRIKTASESKLRSKTDNDIRLSQEPTTSKAAAVSNLNASILNLYKNATNTVTPTNNDDDNEVIRRLSQEPTTSRAAAATNSNKRPISSVIDYEDEDDSALSLNAYNGTRLPHIQPVPPKRKSQSDKPSPIGRDIMDDYIKVITGG